MRRHVLPGPMLSLSLAFLLLSQLKVVASQNQGIRGDGGRSLQRTLCGAAYDGVCREGSSCLGGEEPALVGGGSTNIDFSLCENASQACCLPNEELEESVPGLCNEWARIQSRRDQVWIQLVENQLSCPCTAQEAEQDSRFVDGAFESSMLFSLYHPGALKCFDGAVQLTASNGESDWYGQQCCYGKRPTDQCILEDSCTCSAVDPCYLLVEGLGAGTLDKRSPVQDVSAHRYADIEPYELCSDSPNGFQQYTLYRPISNTNSCPNYENCAENPGCVPWINLDENENYTPRHECSFVQAGDRFFLFGGREEAQKLEIYDYNNNIWRVGASPPVEFNHFQAIEYEGLIWVIGAFANNEFPFEVPAEDVFVYDPANDVWMQGPKIPADRRRGGGGLQVYNGRFYLVGGNTNGHNGGFVPWMDEFDPRTGIWARLDDAPYARDHFHAAIVGDKLYAIGGRRTSMSNTFGDTISEVDVFDFATRKWLDFNLPDPLPDPRAAAATAVYNGKILIAGGESGRSKMAHDDVHALDPSSGKWEILDDLNHARHGTQAIVSGQGIYVAAGSPRRGGGNQRNMEVYNMDAPVGVPSLAGSLSSSPTEILFGAPRVVTLRQVGGNQGVFVSFATLNGPQASNFRVISGVSSILIPNGQTHDLLIEYTGSEESSQAQLLVIYSGDQVLSITLFGKRPPAPTPFPTERPTNKPTLSPTDRPSLSPTGRPTPFPTERPTNKPTLFPTARPSLSPTGRPTPFPTERPTSKPTLLPTARPSSSPTGRPTPFPTERPTSKPTLSPTDRPSLPPTSRPTPTPTPFPSASPSSSPTKFPTPAPVTPAPTLFPTKSPTPFPSAPPSNSPTKLPTLAPVTPSPTTFPTKSPTPFPSASPSSSPTKLSTPQPTPQPSRAPSPFPSIAPTPSPTSRASACSEATEWQNDGPIILFDESTEKITSPDSESIKPIDWRWIVQSNAQGDKLATGIEAEFEVPLHLILDTSGSSLQCGCVTSNSLTLPSFQLGVKLRLSTYSLCQTAALTEGFTLSDACWGFTLSNILASYFSSDSGRRKRECLQEEVTSAIALNSKASAEAVCANERLEPALIQTQILESAPKCGIIDIDEVSSVVPCDAATAPSCSVDSTQCCVLDETAAQIRIDLDIPFESFTRPNAIAVVNSLASASGADASDFVILGASGDTSATMLIIGVFPSFSPTAAEIALSITQISPGALVGDISLKTVPVQLSEGIPDFISEIALSPSSPIEPETPEEVNSSPGEVVTVDSPLLTFPPIPGSSIEPTESVVVLTTVAASTTLLTTKSPTPFPSASPSSSPTNLPTPSPTPQPTKSPTPFPSASPSSSPTELPTPVPTPQPTRMPSSSPSSLPTPQPTRMTTVKKEAAAIVPAKKKENKAKNEPKGQTRREEPKNGKVKEKNEPKGQTTRVETPPKGEAKGAKNAKAKKMSKRIR